MDARFLTQAHRDRLKRIIYTRRDEIAKVIKRMEARQWYTDDAVILNLKAAYNSLHAAVQVIGALDGTPQQVKREGPVYPLPETQRRR